MLHAIPLGNIQEACAQGTILFGLTGETEAYNVQITLIEDLFQVQTNPLRLLNHHLYFKTPMLVAVAMFCWLVPIATLYPPGTLVVGLQPSSIDQSFNVSVFHHRTLQDVADDNVIAMIDCAHDCGDVGGCNITFTPDLAENASLLATCATFPNNITPDMAYIIRSNLIVGEISRLKQSSRENSSYGLDFWGTTLDCETTNRSMESTILQLSFLEGTQYQRSHSEPICELRNNIGSEPFPVNTSIILRAAYYQDTPQYWPCLDKTKWHPTINGSLPELGQDIDFPGSGIHVIVPTTETVCRPRILKYYVTISHAGGTQHVSFTMGDEEFVPNYTREFRSFNGTFERWLQLSDAMLIYQHFAMGLNQSGNTFEASTFDYPSMLIGTKPYTTENGTVVETCVLEAVPMGIVRVPGPWQGIWPFGVFEQRLHENGIDYDCPAFDPDMANELLINTTISALALNQRFDIVNGTETRTFNVYRFENKLAFFLPYGLSLALAIPILALGFVALYVLNHGVSAISGGFMQLLMTTTGRSSLEAVVTRGPGTLGGYENVSEELRGMEIRFGELGEVIGDEVKKTDTLLSGHGHVDVQNDDSSQSGVRIPSGTERFENGVSVARRAGFGTADEVIPFRKNAEQ